MSSLKALLRDEKIIKYTVFTGFNIFLFCVIYFVLKNLSWFVDKIILFSSSLLSAFMPLIIGIIIAYILDPLVEIIHHKFLAKFYPQNLTDPIKKHLLFKRARLFSVLFTYIIIIAISLIILYGLVTLIIGQVSFQSVSKTFQTLISYFENYQVMINNWLENLPDGIIAEKAKFFVESAVKWVSGSIRSGGVIETIKSITGGIINLLVGMVAGIYLLKDKDFFLNLCNKCFHILLGQKTHGIVRECCYDINGVLSTFIRGALIDSVIVSILSSLALSIQGISFAVFIGCFAGITNVIPYFGPFLGIIPTFIVATASGGFSKGIIAVLSLFIIQQIDCNFIYPKIVGSTTGLHPLFVLTAVSVAGYYGGIIWMILAVPIAGIINVFVSKWAIKQ